MKDRKKKIRKLEKDKKMRETRFKRERGKGSTLDILKRKAKHAKDRES